MSKSGVAGKTVIVRVGGLGSELPAGSITVREVTYSPGVVNTTFPGTCAVDIAGDPPGKIQEYCAALVVVLNETGWPAVIVTSVEGIAIELRGGAVAKGES
jgi:hypothetical protein